MYTSRDLEIIKTIILQNTPGAAEIILFGSYANGTARENSDLDIMILLDRKYDWRERRDVLNHLYRDTAQNGYLVDFLLKTKDAFEHDRHMPTLSHTIASEGQPLWMKP